MLEIDHAIRRRLETISGIRGVYGFTDVQQAVAGKQLPAIFVGSDGYRIEETAGQKRATLIATKWLIVVVSRNVSEMRSGAAARADVAPIVRDTFARLLGWRPGPLHQQLRPINPPPPQYDNGLILFPLAFESTTIIQSHDKT